MSKKIIFILAVITFAVLFNLPRLALVPSAQAAVCPTLTAGSLFKVPDNSAVYLLNANMERMYFPHASVYKSWYEDYSAVVEIPNTCVDNYPVPSAPPYGVNYRPGSRLVKVQISPSVYVVEPGNQRAKIGSEAVARALYGDNWASLVVDIADVFWPNYVSSGSEITEAVPHDGMLVKTANNANVFYIKNGVRYNVVGNVRGDVRIISQAVMDRLANAGRTFVSSDIYANPTQLLTVDTQPEEDEEIILDANDETEPVVISSIRLTNATGESINPSIAYNGENFGLVWEDKRAGGIGSDIFFALIDKNGNKLITDTSITNTPDLISTNPEIVWNGNGFGVVYAEYSEGASALETVNFVRLSTGGVVIGNKAEVASGVVKPHPSLAWSGDGYGIVYRSPNTQSAKQYYAFVNATGVITKYPVQILTDEGSPETEIVWDGEMFAIVYRQSPRVLAFGDTISYTVGTYLYRVDKNGNAEAPSKFINGKEVLAAVWTGSKYATIEQSNTFSVFSKIGSFDVSSAQISSVDLSQPDLVYNNGNYGFVGVNNNAIYFSEFGSSGSLKKTSTILDEANSSVQSSPRISTNANSYIVVWSDNRDGNNGSELYFKTVAQ